MTHPTLPLAALLLALAGPATAALVAGPGGAAEQGRRMVQAAPVTGAVAPTLDLVSTRIDAVDLVAGTITLRGQKLPLHAELRVLSATGQLLGPRSLRAGQAVRLALEPAPVSPTAPASAASAMPAGSANTPSPAPARRVLLIYIDA